MRARPAADPAREDPARTRSAATASGLTAPPPVPTMAPGGVRRAAPGGHCACGGGCPRCAGERGQDRSAPKESKAREAPPSVRRALRDSGRPLDEVFRAYMEDRLGTRLGDVRIHDGPSAARSATEIGARAYAAGRDIVLGDGGTRPGDPRRRSLLAHELIHVAQSRDLPPAAPDRLVLGREDDPAEAEARRLATAAMLGHDVVPSRLAGAVDGTVVVRRDPVAEPPTSTQEGPAFAEAEALAGSPVPRDSDVDTARLSYAFFYTGGGYGNSARQFIRTFYPDHVRVEGTTFEGMFDRLWRDVRRLRRSGQRVHIDEIVIVTHANSAGGLQIPLARDDVGSGGPCQGGRCFTPWDLAELQEEFQDRTEQAHRRRQRFRERRSYVVREAIDDDTSIVVRGCEFGQSEDGLDALRSFFGGHVYVWAPTVYQGYEVAPIGSSHLESAAEAFDVLQAQGLIPQDLSPSPREKSEYLARELGITGDVPTQFFVMGKEDHDELVALGSGGLAQPAEALKIRQGVDLPSLGDNWGLSAPPALGSDAELDALSLDEIERRARLLRENYRPAYAPMLLRLRDAWQRHPESLSRALEDTSGDPLAGLPPMDVFGDSNLLAMDAAAYEEPPLADSFEAQPLPFAPPAEGAPEGYTEGVAVGEPESPTPSEAGGDLPAPEEAVSPIPGGGASLPPPTTGGAGGPGPGRRRVASPAELARARSFDKGRRPPQPEPAETEIPDPEGLDDAIRAVLEQLPEEGWQTSNYLGAADLTISVLTAPAMFIESGAAIVFAWEAAGLLAPILSTIGLFFALDEAAEEHKSGARALGIRLALHRLGLLVVSESFSATSISTSELYAGLSEHPEVVSAIRYNIPFGGSHVLPNVRAGCQVVARAANETMRNAERLLRRGLESGSLGPHDVQLAYDSMIAEYRRQALLALVRVGHAAVQRRRDALEARER